jgi:hypothetical protein
MLEKLLGKLRANRLHKGVQRGYNQKLKRVILQLGRNKNGKAMKYGLRFRPTLRLCFAALSRACIPSI